MATVRNFGGCRRLASDYRAIGISLLRFEHSCAAILVTDAFHAQQELRTDVASISTETLEAYLDDLIDTSRPLEELYLMRGKINFLSLHGMTLLALGLAAVVGLITIATDFPLAASAAASPLILVAALFTLSRHHSVRRLRFAHVLRTVINSRKGSGSRRIFNPKVIVSTIGSAAA